MGFNGSFSNYLLTSIANGELWVCVFCLLSGYLLNKKQIKTVRDAINNTVIRYVRLALPLFLANCFVFIISRTFGFASVKCGTLYANAWLASKYSTSYSKADVLKNSILMDNKMNMVFWVIRHMFIASALIYCVNFISLKIPKYALILRIAVTCVLFCVRSALFIGVCFLGTWVDYLESKMNRESSVLKILTMIALIMMLGVQNALAHISGCKVLHVNPYWEAAYSFLIILGIRNSVKLQNVIERVHLPDNAEISMTLYLLHWPILCSVSAAIFYECAKRKVPFYITHVVVFSVTIVVLAAIIYIWNQTAAKVSANAIKCVRRYLRIG